VGRRIGVVVPATQWAGCLLAVLLLLGFRSIANIPTVANVPPVAGDPALITALAKKQTF
jgi:hypothetical protein